MMKYQSQNMLKNKATFSWGGFSFDIANSGKWVLD